MSQPRFPLRWLNNSIVNKQKSAWDSTDPCSLNVFFYVLCNTQEFFNHLQTNYSINSFSSHSTHFSKMDLWTYIKYTIWLPHLKWKLRIYCWKCLWKVKSQLYEHNFVLCLARWPTATDTWRYWFATPVLSRYLKNPYSEDPLYLLCLRWKDRTTAFHLHRYTGSVTLVRAQLNMKDEDKVCCTAPGPRFQTEK